MSDIFSQIQSEYFTLLNALLNVSWINYEKKKKEEEEAPTLPKHNWSIQQIGENLRFSEFKVCILVDHVTECYVVEIVFSSNHNVEFLIQNIKLAWANQAS